METARGALVDPSDAENLGAWSEVLAFALATGRHENPWNSYFGPMGSGAHAEGNKHYFPDITGTPPEAVAHWAARARSLKHPFLRARYADLAWEMSGLIGKRKRDPEDARVAIDSYLGAIPRMAEDHEHVLFAIRALDLAVLIGDKERTDRARAALMDIHRKLMKTHAGMWWYTVDRLLEDKKARVTDQERAELVADLESVVTNGSNTGHPDHFNPHEAKDAAERLIPHYRRLGKFEDIKRLHKAVGDSFEQRRPPRPDAAGTSSRSAMGAMMPARQEPNLESGGIAPPAQRHRAYCFTREPRRPAMGDADPRPPRRRTLFWPVRCLD